MAITFFGYANTNQISWGCGLSEQVRRAPVIRRRHVTLWIKWPSLSDLHKSAAAAGITDRLAATHASTAQLAITGVIETALRQLPLFAVFGEYFRAELGRTFSQEFF